MSLRKKYKTNSTAANDGVWLKFADAPNANGTVPGFKVARRSTQNKAYQRAMREVANEYMTDEGKVDMSGLSDEAAEALELRTFVDTILLDWENFFPEATDEDDGKELAYTKDAARKVFSNPDWSDLLADINKRAGSQSSFREQVAKADAKN